MIHVSAEDLEYEVRQAAIENPEFIYEKPDEHDTCLYFDYNTEGPSCLIGHGLARLGVTIEDIGNLNGEGVVDLFEEAMILEPVTAMPESWFEDVQSAQDSGMMWADAISFADDKAADRVG